MFTRRSLLLLLGPTLTFACSGSLSRRQDPKRKHRNMAYAPRPTSGMYGARPSSGLGGHSSTNAQSSVLQARIKEKKLELESLKQLRDLSGGLAGQMEQLEEKLGTLSNGTEAVAAVMANWSTVLRAIHMASAAVAKPNETEVQQTEDEPKLLLPQTLVRIPIEQAEDAKKALQESEARK